MPTRPGCATCSVGTDSEPGGSGEEVYTPNTKRGEATVVIDFTGYDQIILGIIAAILLSVVVLCLYKCIVKYYAKYGTNRSRKDTKINEDVENDSELNPMIVVNE